MKISKTYIDDLIIIEPSVYKDSRGFFYESFKESFFLSNISKVKFTQENISKSKKGVLRGLHFQYPPFEQSKLINVIKGEVLDVAVDLRKGSKTFGNIYSITLSELNKKQLFIPKGFAHGFYVKSKYAIFSYKVDNEYNPKYESGINFMCNQLSINWEIDGDIIVSQKDKNLPFFDKSTNYGKR